MAKKGLRRGIFITFEGTEGCGKTTHASLIKRYLSVKGYDCVLTREPGGTKLGESIRKVLLHSKDVRISDLAELFLFEAARSQILEEVIRPALAKGKVVICDRFTDATMAYQGYGSGIPLEVIRIINKAAALGLRPDLTVLLDIDTATGLKRAGLKGSDRMEQKTIRYHERVRAGYLAIAKNEKTRFRVIKVKGSIGETERLVRHEVDCAIQRHKRAG